ncbi:hypothetical protein LMTR3_21400 [Bradyrhizobium sp. LMTR 3]|nr:hypothetical protein LMTR3_21400 [Bradyrhizobium sp. LMTR 3]
MFALLAAGLGLTVMPDNYRGPDAARVKLAGFDAQRDIGVMFADTATRHGIWPRESQTSAPCREWAASWTAPLSRGSRAGLRSSFSSSFYGSLRLRVGGDRRGSLVAFSGI